ncbi:hypothetical protein GGR57DRAFT_505700 [Xylariaceae sp. FL1272]|nr:hypothetical protein GGR57DRAFT_505700 [Xylariaceae sp. FL1272]
MDPIENLFKELPDPAAYCAAHEDDICRVLNTGPLGPLLESTDRDRVYIYNLLQYFRETQIVANWHAGLGYCALAGPIPDNGSAKSRHMKFHAWVSRGRKDEENPFSDNQSSQTTTGNGHAFLPAKSTHSEICANCGKADAGSRCTGCLVQLGSHAVMQTAYCDKTCQAQHWKEHKVQCVGRRSISRAASLLLDLIVMLQKKAWMGQEIASTFEQNGITYIKRDGLDHRALQGRPFVDSFPTSKAACEEHVLAVLMDNEWGSIMISCQGLIELLLRPACKALDVVSAVVRNIHRPTSSLDNGESMNNAHLQHSVLRARLKTGEHVVIDLTGAQFGWREVVAPWESWKNHRVSSDMDSSSLDETLQSIREGSDTWAEEFIKFCDSQKMSLAQKMQTAIQDKMQETNISSIAELLALPDSTFTSHRQEILASADKALGDGLFEIRRSKTGLLYFDAEGRWQVTTTKEQAKALKRVWLSDDDMEKAKERKQNPHLIFVQRCSSHERRERFKALGLDMP